MARKYFPYTPQLGTCMGLGFGGVMLLLDDKLQLNNVFLKPVCGVTKLQIHVILERGGGVTVCTAPRRKQHSLLQ